MASKVGNCDNGYQHILRTRYRERKGRFNSGRLRTTRNVLATLMFLGSTPAGLVFASPEPKPAVLEQRVEVTGPTANHAISTEVMF